MKYNMINPDKERHEIKRIVEEIMKMLEANIDEKLLEITLKYIEHLARIKIKKPSELQEKALNFTHRVSNI